LSHRERLREVLLTTDDTHWMSMNGQGYLSSSTFSLVCLLHQEQRLLRHCRRRRVKRLSVCQTTWILEEVVLESYVISNEVSSLLLVHKQVLAKKPFLFCLRLKFYHSFESTSQEVDLQLDLCMTDLLQCLIWHLHRQKELLVFSFLPILLLIRMPSTLQPQLPVYFFGYEVLGGLQCDFQTLPIVG